MLFHLHIFVFVLSLHGISSFSPSSPHALTYTLRAIFKSLYEDFPGTSNSLELFSRLNSFPIIFCATSFTLSSLTEYRIYELFLFPVLDYNLLQSRDLCITHLYGSLHQIRHSVHVLK